MSLRARKYDLCADLKVQTNLHKSHAYLDGEKSCFLNFLACSLSKENLIMTRYNNSGTSVHMFNYVENCYAL
jgi:hypothetical protein